MGLILNILSGLILIFILFTIIGLIKPRIVFRKNRFHVIRTFGFSAFILFLIFSLTVHFLGII